MGFWDTPAGKILETRPRFGSADINIIIRELEAGLCSRFYWFSKHVASRLGVAWTENGGAWTLLG